MDDWREFGRINAQGLSLETTAGHAEIETGYTDHQLRVTVQREGRPAYTARFGDLDTAKRWAEAQLASPPPGAPASFLRTPRAASGILHSHGGRHQRLPVAHRLKR